MIPVIGQLTRRAYAAPLANAVNGFPSPRPTIGLSWQSA
jgi:hypothetical protein